MIPNRKILGAAAFSLALAGGGVAGAMLGTPSVSIAKSTSSLSATADPDAGGVGRFEHRGEGLAAAAEALGMSEDDLKAELQGGKSIAEVAADQGVDVQDVIDALVADASARLDELKTELPDRIAELVNRTGWGNNEPGPVVEETLSKAAEVIGVTPEELRDELDNGSTIAEVATAHGVDLQDVIDALVADGEARIDQAVADGKIDEARGEEIKANLTERITARVNGERPERGRPGGPGHRGGPGRPFGSTDAAD